MSEFNVTESMNRVWKRARQVRNKGRMVDRVAAIRRAVENEHIEMFVFSAPTGHRPENESERAEFFADCEDAIVVEVARVLLSLYPERHGSR